jgi:cytochrome c-type biogenesis protein CcmH/NrfG
MAAETESALEDLAKRSKIDDVVAEPKTSLPTATGEDSEVRAEQLKVDEGEDKLAKAAAERKMARIKRRLPAEYVWEPDSDASTRFVVLVALLIAVIAAATVYLTIFWR